MAKIQKKISKDYDFPLIQTMSKGFFYLNKMKNLGRKTMN